MKPLSYQELVDTATVAARAGAEVLRRYFRSSDLEVSNKGRHDLVSQADYESEEQIVATIRRRYPDHRILAEEGGASAGDSEFEWLIDPLDGTANFVHGLPVFCISIACRHRRQVVAATVLEPIGDNLFSAARGSGARWNGREMRVSSRRGLDEAFLATGFPFRARGALDAYLDIFRDVFLEVSSVRRCGAAALDLAYTAAGVYDGFFEFRLSPWDFAAGALLIEESGGLVTDLDGGDGYFTGGSLVAGPPGLHAELLRVVRRHVDEERLTALAPLVR